MRGRGGSRAWIGEGREGAGRAGRRKDMKPGEMFHWTEYTGNSVCSGTETSRNLTKRFREDNNSDLKHQRVI